jgi:hypothetical protein
MTTRFSLPLRAATVAALAAAASLSLFASAATAASVPVDLRVVGPTGEILGDYTQYTDSVSVKTDKKASCFGQGTEGSGDKVDVKGKTALGAVVDGAAAGDTDLKPVSVTDAFDFGLGLCGIGGEVAPETGFWYLKTDNVESQLGGDQTKVKKGDAVTWFLDTDFADAPPVELELETPAAVAFDTPTEVQVFEYGPDGTRTPAAGVEVTGASAPTGADGTTQVSLTTARPTLTATRDGAISDQTLICAAADAGDCPKQPGTIIGGSSGSDEIKGTKGPDSVNGGGDDDRIDVRDGEVDDVTCGGGKKDKVKADRDDEVAKSCEKVKS